MFDNWYLFLLIIFLVFAADGSVSGTELAVMLAILFALTLTANCCPDSDTETNNCFCNHTVT